MDPVFYSEEAYREYQDELNAVPQTELQMSYAQSFLEKPLQDQTKTAERLVADGKFVLMSEATRYCPRADGIMGCDILIDEVFISREKAEAELNRIYEAMRGVLDDVRYTILPHLPVEPDPIIVSNDECPF